MPFLRALLARGCTLALPRIDRAGRRLELYLVDDLDEQLQPGTWGILEPTPARCRRAEPAELDLVLVPGVAFDPHGGRVGYGGGYYDGLFATWPGPPPRLVAAAFDLQVVPEVPVLARDRRMDQVVTESRLYPESPITGREGR
jgi:5-formyltetrahydrofolate cyclo-ligase